MVVNHRHEGWQSKAESGLLYCWWSVGVSGVWPIRRSRSSSGKHLTLTVSALLLYYTEYFLWSYIQPVTYVWSCFQRKWPNNCRKRRSKGAESRTRWVKVQYKLCSSIFKCIVIKTYACVTFYQNLKIYSIFFFFFCLTKCIKQVCHYHCI